MKQSLNKADSVLSKSFFITEKTDDQIPLLPVHLESGPNRAGLNIEQFCVAVLDCDHPHITVIAGEMGAGKSTLGCLLVRWFVERCNAHTLYLPLKYAEFYKEAPEARIRAQLGLPADAAIWYEDERQNIVILDGLDEMLTQSNLENTLTWLNNLIDVAPVRSRIIIIGRPEAFGSDSPYPELWERLCNLCRCRALPHLPAFCYVAKRDHQAHMRILEELWSSPADSATVRLGEKLKQEVVSSPLMFQFAYIWLYNQKQLAAGTAVPPVIESEWQLTDYFIESVIAREINRSSVGKLSQPQIEALARKIALVLCLSGRGMAGMTQDDLQALIEDFLPEEYRFPDLHRLSGAILLIYGRDAQRYSPFHHQLLIHLTAQFFSDLACLSTDTGSGSDTSLPLPDFVTQSWQNLARLLHLPDMVMLDAYIRSYGAPESLNPNSDLQKAITYWIRQIAPHAGLTRLPIVDNSAVPTGTLGDLPVDARISLGVLGMILDAVLPYMQDSEPGQNPPPPPDGDQGSFICIPPGYYRYWAINEQGNRELREYHLGSTVFIRENPVTVAEYAAYLNAWHPDPAHFPDQAEAQWHIDEQGQVSYSDTATATIIQGISHDDAQDFIQWLNQQHQSQVPPAIAARLPRPRFGLPPHGVLMAAYGDVISPFVGETLLAPHDPAAGYWLHCLDRENRFSCISGHSSFGPGVSDKKRQSGQTVRHALIRADERRSYLSLLPMLYSADLLDPDTDGQDSILRQLSAAKNYGSLPKILDQHHDYFSITPPNPPPRPSRFGDEERAGLLKILSEIYARRGFFSTDLVRSGADSALVARRAVMAEQIEAVLLCLPLLDDIVLLAWLRFHDEPALSNLIAPVMETISPEQFSVPVWNRLLKEERKRLRRQTHRQETAVEVELLDSELASLAEWVETFKDNDATQFTRLRSKLNITGSVKTDDWLSLFTVVRAGRSRTVFGIAGVIKLLELLKVEWPGRTAQINHKIEELCKRQP